MCGDSPAPSGSLLVFADDWGRHPSSCQHLVRHLRDDFRVIWANTIGTRRLQLDGLTIRRGLEKIGNWTQGVRSGGSDLRVVDLPMLPGVGGRFARSINPYLVGARLSRVLGTYFDHEPIVLTTLPYVGQLISRVKRKAVVYYCTDDYSFWPGADRQSLQVAEAELCRNADAVIAASRALAARLSIYRESHYIPHGVDYNHFATAASIENPPAEIDAIPGPRIGFFGLIYEKLDFELLAGISKRFPAATLVMIGPVDFCPDNFRSLPNVYLIGKKPYADLPRWIAGLDVLLMPYVDDEMIRQSNPLKLRECLATGKPTVCVDVPEARLLEPHVRVAANRTQFIDLVGEALVTPTDRQKSSAQQQIVSGDDWSHRARQLSEILKGLSCAPTA